MKTLKSNQHPVIQINQTLRREVEQHSFIAIILCTFTKFSIQNVVILTDGAIDIIPSAGLAGPMNIRELKHCQLRGIAGGAALTGSAAFNSEYFCSRVFFCTTAVGPIV
jgi:hypothetical protein